MNMQNVSVGVVGAGVMGSGIAQVMATAGYSTVLYARRPEAVEVALQGILASLIKLHGKSVVQEEPAAILARIMPCHELSGLAGCSLIIEAITEDIQAKCQLFTALDGIIKPTAVLATTTTSLSITQLAGALRRPEQFVGMHFMNPVPLMEVVELIAGQQTSDATGELARVVVTATGKQYVASADRPGFIISRLLIPPINEAFELLREGVADAVAIDTAMKLGANHPMGPLALADLIGLDVILSAMETLMNGLDAHKYAASPLLREYVAQGRLGRKSGQGVYCYGI